MVDDDDDEITDLWETSITKHSITPKKSPALVVDHQHKPPYCAFETQDKLLGFQVYCPSVQQEHTFFYHHLHTITISKPASDYFFLLTSTSVVKVRGRNLHPLAVALGLHTCKSMTEFHAEWFLPPTDDTQPYIEKIEVALMKGAGEGATKAGQ